MNPNRNPILPLLVALFATVMALVPAGAGAATGGDINVRLYRADQPYGSVRVDLVEPAVTHTLRLRRGDLELSRASSRVGDASLTGGHPTLRPGDVVELYKPAIPKGAPAVAPIASYRIPDVSLAYANGAVTGTAGESTQARLDYSPPCGGLAGARRVDLDLVAGAFTDRRQLPPGTRMELAAFDGVGDVTAIDAVAAGESPCLIVYGSEVPFLSPSDPSAAKPFQVYLYGLSDSVANSVRLVWRRGASVVEDQSTPGSTISVHSSTRPRAGDRFEVYRPMNAAEPLSVQTLPEIRAVFDSEARLLRVDAPAAEAIVTYLRDITGVNEDSGISLAPVSAGRTFFDFDAPPNQAPSAPFPEEIAEVGWQALGGTPGYFFLADPGDLTRPEVRMLTGRKLRLSRAGKRFSLKLRVAEPVTGTLTLSVPRRGGGGAPLKLAVARIKKRAGTSRVVARLNRRGRAEAKRLTRNGRGHPATLTLKVKDAAGNATTSVKKIGLVTR